ncbi:tetratricopeptide repeat protein [Alkalicaulis satelles]|uniref:Tetratricopeptide repeat protein n=1 Tax=Alkalicaulis satelles TaxID=2609175 RepID=A0A5M6ZAA7_9PROT|nr:tetratricopeptide repeat-containing sulfotransferase family protein [Alkalicaulis satelles]KAA5801632.1 tetratricopeptide repeat protein [Alkalicaulis satelles]
MKGAFADALETLAPVLAAEPGHGEALYMSAVCQRYLKQFGAAQATLDALKAAQPEFGRAWQEEGHLLRAQGESRRALAAYQRACQYNPALTASWAVQADILTELGQSAEAAQAAAQGARVAGLPKPLIAVMHHLHEGRLMRAETLCRSFLKANPKHVEGMRLLAEIGVRFNITDDAEFLLESALEFEPDNVQVRLDYIQVLRKRQKFAAALDQARQLMARDPDNPLFLSHFAIEAMQTGDYEAALNAFDKVLETLPGDPATLTSRGHALKTAGESERAVGSYKAALASQPSHADAWYALANLKTYRFSDEELAAMEKSEADGALSHAQRIHLSFALGKAYEDRKDFERAFGAYARGNELKRRQTRYTSDQMEEELEAQKALCTPDLFARQSGKGHDDPAPIFIVGLPRAGSTLLEQILASHSQVDGTLELPNILAIAHSLRGRDRSDRTRYPRILHEMEGGKLEALGRRYIEETAIHRQGAPFFTDKMPNNFRHIGLIRLILPHAKIIDARRHPMASCVSGFKQLFAEGQEFTYGLEEIGRYYRAYVELMDHWDTVQPGSVLRVIHEDVVDDIETQVRRILDFCGLAFEPACLEFHKTRRQVRTASSEQVRQPINRAGLEQWRAFEPWLDPLKDALGPVLDDWRRDGARATRGALSA